MNKYRSIAWPKSANCIIVNLNFQYLHFAIRITSNKQKLKNELAKWVCTEPLLQTHRSGHLKELLKIMPSDNFNACHRTAQCVCKAHP